MTYQKLPGIGLLTGLLLFCGVGTGPLNAQEPGTDEYVAVLERAKTLSEQNDTRDAIEEYERANELAGGQSRVSLLSLTILYNLEREFPQAAEHARRFIALSEEPAGLHRAYRELGMALHLDVTENKGRDPKAKRKRRKARKAAGETRDAKIESKLREAEEAFRKALEIEENEDGTTYFFLANVLADQMVRGKQWALHDEVKALSLKYLESHPDGSHAEWARRASCQLDRSRRGNSGKGKEAADESSGQAEEPPAPAVNFGGEMVKPEKLSTRQPQYSPWARSARVQGAVILTAIIDRQGSVRDAKVVQGLPLCLSEQAIKAVEQWRFTPATLDGEAIDVYYNVAINFRLE